MYAVFDCETDEWSKSKVEQRSDGLRSQHLALKLIVCRVYEESTQIHEFVGYSAKEFIDWLLKIKGKGALHLYAHNLDFDIMFLFNELRTQFQKLVPIFNAKMLELKCYARNRLHLCFLNSLCLLPFSVKSLGNMFHMDKLKADFAKLDESLITYCKRDVEIVHIALEKLAEFCKSLNLPITVERFPLSTPSLALRLFVLENSDFTSDKGKNLLLGVPRWINEYFRKHYFGGRTEVFSFQKYIHSYYLDINSLYPTVMMKYRYPIPPYYYVDIKSIQDFDQYEREGKICAYEGLLDERNESIPLIPQKIDLKTAFTASIKECLLTPAEFTYCKTAFTVKRVWLCAGWCQPFEYFTQIYEKRKAYKAEGNAMHEFCKLFMNSTYGKMAQKPNRNSVQYVSDITSIEDIIGAKIEFFEDVHLIMISKEYMAPNDITNVLFALYTTAHARLELTTALHQIKAPIYCDTDSIVVDSLEGVKLPIGVELGQWKIEQEMYQFHALAPKEYLYNSLVETIAGMNIFDASQRCKGIGRNERLTEYHTTGIDIIRPAKWKESIRRNIEAGSAIIVHKKSKNTFSKRKISDNGLTEPFTGNISEQSITEWLN